MPERGKEGTAGKARTGYNDSMPEDEPGIFDSLCEVSICRNMEKWKCGIWRRGKGKTGIEGDEMGMEGGKRTIVR